MKGLTFPKKEPVKGSVTGSTVTYANFKSVQRPKFADTIFFPEVLSDLTASNITDLIGRYTEMYAYANQEVALADVEILRLNRQEYIRKNRIFDARPGLNSLNKNQRETVYDSDPDIERITLERNQWEQVKRLTEAYLANYDRYLNALSRELTRKTSERGPYGTSRS